MQKWGKLKQEEQNPAKNAQKDESCRKFLRAVYSYQSFASEASSEKEY